MFISSLHFSGPVPPCIRTDTASDYRTTFFKGPEVNVPVFCIIKVITHGGRQRLSGEKGAWADGSRSVRPGPGHPGVLRLARFWTCRLAWSCDRPHWQTTSQTTGQAVGQSMHQVVHGEKPTRQTAEQPATPAEGVRKY